VGKGLRVSAVRFRGFVPEKVWRREVFRMALTGGRVVERSPHFLPTLKFLHFSTLSLLGFKRSSPTSKHSLFEVLLGF